MNRELISRALGEIAERHVSEAVRYEPGGVAGGPERIITMSDIQATRRSSRRIAALILAACLLLSLGIAAYAAGWFSLKEATITDSRIEDVYENEVQVGKSLVPATVITLSGLEGTPEYQAAKEWREFYNAYVANNYNGDAFGQDLGEWGEAHKDAYWDIYTPALAEKFQSICEAYGLAARSGKYEGVDSALYPELSRRLGISPFLSGSGRLSEDPDYYDYYILYDNGSFSCHDLWWPHDDFDNVNLAVWSIGIIRSVKGYMNTETFDFEPDETLEEWQYTTAAGEPVDLVMGENSALILYDGEYAFVSICWQQLNLMRPDLSHEDLERYADTVDFAALGSKGAVSFPGTGVGFVQPTPEP